MGRYEIIKLATKLFFRTPIKERAGTGKSTGCHKLSVPQAAAQPDDWIQVALREQILI